MNGRYRVLRPGVSQRERPGGPIVDREVGEVIEVSDSMAAFYMAAREPFVEPVEGEKPRRRRKKAEED